MQRIPVFHTQTLGTLSNVTSAQNEMLETSDNEYRVLSVKLNWSWRGVTAGEGPIEFGVCHGDYTQTEVDEALEAEAAILRGDKVLQEQANRLVRRLGMIDPLGQVAGVFDNGRQLTTRLNWVISEGKTLNMFAYNRNGSALTTGSNLQIGGHAIIKWI